MLDKIYLIVIILLLIITPLVVLYYYKKGKIKGAGEFLDLIIAGGFEQKVKDFKQLNQNVKLGGVVFVGDSITQDYNIHEWYPNCHCYNRGIGGDTTINLLKRLDVSVYELKPKKIVLLIGTNDLELTNDSEISIAKRVEKIVEEIHAFDDIEIFLLSVLPTNQTMDKNTVGKRSINRIMALNKYLSEIKHVNYIDMFSKLIDENKYLKESYSIEGLHLSQLGYQVMTDVLKPLLFD